MRATIFIILIIILSVSVVADNVGITMKTNEEYVAQFRISNSDGDVLKNCYPYFQNELWKEEWVSVIPQSFDLQPGESQDLVIKFTYPPSGYYQDDFQIKCERYFEGTFIGVFDLISPPDQPKYAILVKIAGEGQSYYFPTGKQYNFFAKEGGTERASFKIANTGTTDLPIEIRVPPEYSTIIKVDPLRFTIDRDEIETVKLIINVPQGFESINTSLTVLVGDFEEQFRITGERETFTSGTAGLGAVAQGDISIGFLEIPTWLILIILVITTMFLLRDSKKTKRK